MKGPEEFRKGDNEREKVRVRIRKGLCKKGEE